MRPSLNAGRRLAHTAALAALAISLAACTPNVAEKLDQPEPEPAPAGRLVQAVQPRPAAPEVTYPSSLYIERDVLVAAPSTGVIEEVLVDRGARVKAGDPLAVMESEIFRRELEIAEQEARQARADFDRIAPLHHKRVISEAEYVEAEIALDGAIARRELARAWLERCTVKAPFDGVVVERWAVQGQRVQEEDGIPLFRVVASEPLRARIDVPEESLAPLGQGTPASVEDVSSGCAHPARIVFVSPAINAASGTVPVIVQMEERSDHLRVGATVRVRFAADPPSGSAAMLIPRSTLANGMARENEVTRVMVIEGGRATAREVRVLEIRGGSALVEGEITPESRVIVGGDGGVTEGEPVIGREAAL